MKKIALTLIMGLAFAACALGDDKDGTCTDESCTTEAAATVSGTPDDEAAAAQLGDRPEDLDALTDGGAKTNTQCLWGAGVDCALDVGLDQGSQWCREVCPGSTCQPHTWIDGYACATKTGRGIQLDCRFAINFQSEPCSPGEWKCNTEHHAGGMCQYLSGQP